MAIDLETSESTIRRTTTQKTHENDEDPDSRLTSFNEDDNESHDCCVHNSCCESPHKCCYCLDT